MFTPREIVFFVITIGVCVAISFVLQYDLFTYYTEEFERINSKEELAQVHVGDAISIEITPNYFFFVERKDQSNNTVGSFYITTEFGNELVIEDTTEGSQSTNSIVLNGIVSTVGRQNDALLEQANMVPNLTLQDNQQSSIIEILRDEEIDWSTEINTDTLVLELREPPRNPNTRLLINILFVLGSMSSLVLFHNHKATS